MEKLLNLVLEAEHKSYMNKIIQDWTLTKVIVLVQDNKLNSPRGRDRSIKTELEDNPEGQKTEGLHRLRGPLGCTVVYNVCVKLSRIYYFPKSGRTPSFVLEINEYKSQDLSCTGQGQQCRGQYSAWTCLHREGLSQWESWNKLVTKKKKRKPHLGKLVKWQNFGVANVVWTQYLSRMCASTKILANLYAWTFPSLKWL